MGYNKSRRCVVRNLRLLKRMKEELGTFTIASRDPAAHTQRIREAIYASSFYPEFKEFHDLQEWYEIKRGKRSIIFEWRGPDLGTLLLRALDQYAGEHKTANKMTEKEIRLALLAAEQLQRENGMGNPVNGYEWPEQDEMSVKEERKTEAKLEEMDQGAVLSQISKPRIEVAGVLDLLNVIGTAIKLDQTNDEIYFVDTNLEIEDKKKLYDWCKEQNWKYIDHEGEGLTLTRKDVDPFILWEPEE